MAGRRDGTGGGAYSLRKVEIKLTTLIQNQEARIKKLEDQIEKMLKETKGSAANDIVKATAANTEIVKKLIDFKLTELKALAEENGINDEGFTKKADYVKALKEKDPTLE